MLHCYRIYREYYLDGKRLIKTYYGYCIDENKEEETIDVNWNDLDDLYTRYWYSFSFHFEKCRKGRKIKFNDIKKVIKEWKTPNLNMTVKVIYQEADDIFSINEILEYHNGEKAIRYLVERGVSLAKTV